MIHKKLPLIFISIIFFIEVNSQTSTTQDPIKSNAIKTDTIKSVTVKTDTIKSTAVTTATTKSITLKKDTVFSTAIKTVINKNNIASPDSSKTDNKKPDEVKADSDTYYFYSEDLFIAGETYWLGCKDTVRNGQDKFKFYLYKDEIRKGFEMNRIDPSEKNTIIFNAEMQKAFRELNSDTINQEQKDQINRLSSGFLYNIKLNAEVSDSAYVVGELLLAKDLVYYHSTNNNPKPKVENTYVSVKTGKSTIVVSTENPLEEPKEGKTIVDEIKKKITKTGGKTTKLDSIGTIGIEKAVIKFENEQIVDIKVFPKDNPHNIKLFQNRIPISYATKADVSRDRRIKGLTRLYDTQNSYCIIMADVFTNDYQLLNKTENYSPKDQIVTLYPNKKSYIMKDNVTDLFRAQVYSDLLGLNSDQPNGLIQTEVSKRVYLSRRVINIGKTDSYFGLINSINPLITISKIEDNNKYLVTEGGTDICVNSLDLFKYTSWKTGGELNLFYIGCPSLQSIFYVNAGFYIMNVPMRLNEDQDSLDFHDIKVNKDDNTFHLNTVTFCPDVHWTISPHSKFQVAFNAQWHFIYNPVKDINIVNGFCSASEEMNEKDLGILSLRFLASLKLNNKADGEFFFRTYYNFSVGYPSNNFLQTQFGYSFNVFDKRSELPLGKQN